MKKKKHYLNGECASDPVVNGVARPAPTPLINEASNDTSTQPPLIIGAHANDTVKSIVVSIAFVLLAILCTVTVDWSEFGIKSTALQRTSAANLELSRTHRPAHEYYKHRRRDGALPHSTSVEHFGYFADPFENSGWTIIDDGSGEDEDTQPNFLLKRISGGEKEQREGVWQVGSYSSTVLKAFCRK